MNRTFQTALITSTLVLLPGSAPGKTRKEVGPQVTLTIRLYDQAQASESVLHSATAETSRLFHATGIRIAWEKPAVELPEDRGIDMSARKSASDERSYLVVRLIRQMPASVFSGALGFALPFARTGAQVTIFYDRVGVLAQSANIAPYIILGHALAHEVGHVLLRSLEHSVNGVMQARYNQTSLHLASAGLLAFRPEEAEQMSAGLGRFRVRHPEHESALAWSLPRPSSE